MSRTSTPSASPTSSSFFVPCVTQTDAERFLQVSHLIEAKMAAQAPSKAIKGENGAHLAVQQRDPLHARLAMAVHDAAQESEFLSTFLAQTTSTLQHQSDHQQQNNNIFKEADLACLIFVASESMRAKLQCLWENLNGDLTQVMLVLLASICSCTSVHESRNQALVIVEGRPEEDHELQRPAKRIKLEEDVADNGLLRTCQSPSFDSSLATLRDEDDHPHRHHVDLHEIVALVLHKVQQSANRSTSLTVDDVMDWWANRSEKRSDYRTARWLELFEVNAWKKYLSSPPNSMFAGTSPASLASEHDNDHDCSSRIPHSATNSSPSIQSPPCNTSPTLISFDFSTEDPHSSSLLIDISEENLQTLQQFVTLTEFWHRPASEMCKALLTVAKRRYDRLEIARPDFIHVLEDRCLPPTCRLGASSASESQQLIHRVLQDFFSLYELSDANDWADLKELAVGMCFFCAGSKSVKLATAFEMLDEKRMGYLTESQLFGYLRSYLLALVALSLLIQTNKKPMSRQRRAGIRAAVDCGARWTLSHYTAGCSLNEKGRYTFESFASWYSTGGYNIAPWLELLDLKKTLALIQSGSGNNSNDAIGSTTTTPLPLPSFPQPAVTSSTTTAPPTHYSESTRHRDRMSSLRRHHSSVRSNGVPNEILFSFPLASNRFLVVLKEDARYVRDVVETLGLLTSTPDDLWTALSKSVAKRRNKQQQSQGVVATKNNKEEPTVYVSCSTFLQCMNDVCRSSGSTNNARKRSSPGSFHPPSRDELLANFFQCFDVGQCDSVALDELMGGLTLLCGGKKSMKLSFAFTIFDTRPEMRKKKKEAVINSLSGEDLFLFLRSILIVTFSCCRQSLDLTDDVVSRCIADTANMICNDVMRHQWETKQTDRCNFDEFGQWYNDGGFERAPWLELLDLRKWVLINDLEAFGKPQLSTSPSGGSTSNVPTPTHQHHQHTSTSASTHTSPSADENEDPTIPPPPPEDALDPSFFDENGLMPMDSMDEMDMMLMPQPSTDREMDSDGVRVTKSFSFSPPPRGQDHFDFNSPPTPANLSPLKFHLITREAHGGYRVSCSRARIDHFRSVLEDCGLQNISAENACNAFLSKASRQTKSDSEPKLTKDGFQGALKTVSSWRPKSSTEKQRTLTGFFDFIFSAFDRDGTGRPSVIEVACGLTVLCQGKKSDKLEFAFEVLDKNKRGLLSKQDMTKYLQSFLTVLLSVALSPSLTHDPTYDTLSTMEGGHCDSSISTIQRAVAVGAEWAAEQAFREFGKGQKKISLMSFDDFADWYTTKGFNSIPWLELIDLRKWSVCS